MKYVVVIVSFLVVGIAGFLVIRWKTPMETIGDFQVVYDSVNALRVTIDFELRESQSVYIEYWADKTKEQIFSTSISSESQHHSITLLGLLEERGYSFVVKEASDFLARMSEVGNFYTERVPRAMLRMRWTEKLESPFTGYILTQRPRVKGHIGYAYMLDPNGETAWYQEVPGLPKLSLWSDRNTILVLSGNPNHERSAGDHIYEFDVYGNELMNLDLTKIATPIEAHHDIQYANDSTLITLIYDKRTVDFSAQDGKPDQEIKGDAIVRLSKSGEILWKWSVFDVLDPVNTTYAFDSLGEWGHANTLSIDRDGNYLISFRDWSEIWKVNSTDGKLIWKLGEHGDFSFPEGVVLSGQHSIHINHKGEYMLFNNGVKSKRSSVVSFTLNEQTKTVDMKMNIQLPKEFYSEKRGSAYFIDEERILVCSAEVSTVSIVDVKGKVLGRAHTGLPDYYRATYVPQLYPHD